MKKIFIFILCTCLTACSTDSENFLISENGGFSKTDLKTIYSFQNLVDSISASMTQKTRSSNPLPEEYELTDEDLLAYSEVMNYIGEEFYSRFNEMGMIDDSLKQICPASEKEVYAMIGLELSNIIVGCNATIDNSYSNEIKNDCLEYALNQDDYLLLEWKPNTMWACFSTFLGIDSYSLFKNSVMDLGYNSTRKLISKRALKKIIKRMGELLISRFGAYLTVGEVGMLFMMGEIMYCYLNNYNNLQTAYDGYYENGQ
ncbi:MAG: hypothetical protein IJK43_10210 [Prevotella sp.]|nr:hypothetical protein [Prevotella sp.]